MTAATTAPLPQPVDDGYDTLDQLVRDASAWGIDPAAVAVIGEIFLDIPTLVPAARAARREILAFLHHA